MLINININTYHACINSVFLCMQYKFSNKEVEAVRHIRNYLMHNGYLPSVRELMRELGFKSPRSAALIIESLIDKGVLKRNKDGNLQLIINKEFSNDSGRAETVNVPLLGTVSCGAPIFASENIEAFIPVSVKLAKQPYKYFLLRAKGDSMNEKGINNGDLVLIKQQQTANNGDDVVALIDDDATIKEFHLNGNTIVLKPRSTNNKHQPIILTTDFKIQGVVIAVIPI